MSRVGTVLQTKWFILPFRVFSMKSLHSDEGAKHRKLSVCQSFYLSVVVSPF